MRTLAKIAVALTAAVSCAAFADTGSDADQVRREANMNEVLAKHHVDLDQYGTQTMPQSKPTMRERSHEVAQKTREETHKVAQSTRDFTHRHMEKLRAFSARQDAKFQAKNGHMAKPSTGEASS
jgi:hypothetical protein